MRIAGYASVFGVPDKGRDIVAKGAFRRTLKEAGPIPLLWQHQAERPIGTVEQVAEDGRGLRVIARLADGSAAGAEALALVKAGALNGLSFGYRVRESREAGRFRELTDLDLIEISLVTFPMQPLARVHAVEG